MSKEEQGVRQVRRKQNTLEAGRGVDLGGKGIDHMPKLPLLYMLPLSMYPIRRAIPCPRLACWSQ